MAENRMSTPTLINLPPPPSDPVTPSEMGPGTPNSGTTSLSALSTTAIKDGHQGHPHPYARHTHQSSSASATSTSTLEAERADRISRLAGLERIATARAGGGGGGGGGTGTSGGQNFAAGAGSTAGVPSGVVSQGGGVTNQGPGGAGGAGGAGGVGGGHFMQQSQYANSLGNIQYIPPAQLGYFDSYPQPLLKERSTVGSASATGSVGGRTTWASGSDMFDPDKMSEDHDGSSVGDDVDVDDNDNDNENENETDRMSDEGNASLVGFGEGASSTISGPISTMSATGRVQSSSSSMNYPRTSSYSSPGTANRNSGGGFGANPLQQQQQQSQLQHHQYNVSHLQSYPQSQDLRFPPSPSGSNTPEPSEDARMVDGVTHDPNVVDTTVRTPRLVGGQNDGDALEHESLGE